MDVRTGPKFWWSGSVRVGPELHAEQGGQCIIKIVEDAKMFQANGIAQVLITEIHFVYDYVLQVIKFKKIQTTISVQS